MTSLECGRSGGRYAIQARGSDLKMTVNVEDVRVENTRVFCREIGPRELYVDVVDEDLACAVI